ncbi:uncharacterized protein LOC144165722 isoform X2 [Haemaphysalis longicornis]
MTRLTFALASSLILPALVATAASPECSRLSLTNIIGLGTCLQNKGELCSPNTGGAVEFLKAFFECFSSGLKKLNVYDQTVILVAFSQYLVERVTAGAGNEVLQGLCKTLEPILKIVTGGTLKLDCGNLQLNSKVICDDPLRVGIPSEIGLGDCLGNMGLACVKGQVVTMSVLESLFKYISATKGISKCWQRGHQGRYATGS